MKKSLSIVSLLAASTLLTANAFAENASQYQVRVFNLADQAVVKVTENGQPVENVPVEVTAGALKQNLTTSENGSVFVRNSTNSARSFTITVKEPNGEDYTTERFISSYN